MVRITLMLSVAAFAAVTLTADASVNTSRAEYAPLQVELVRIQPDDGNYYVDNTNSDELRGEMYDSYGGSYGDAAGATGGAEGGGGDGQHGATRNLLIQRAKDTGADGNMSAVLKPNADLAGLYNEGPAFERIPSPMTTTDFGATEFQTPPIHRTRRAACDGEGVAGEQIIISGVSGACERQLHLDGAWTYQGNTADGKQYWVHGNAYLYYDSHCGGAGIRNDGAQWMFGGKPSETASQDLAGDGRYCTTFGHVDTTSTALPPSRTAWELWCEEGSDKVTKVTIAIASPTCICKLGYSGDNCEKGSAPPACDGEGAAGKQMVVSGMCDSKYRLNGAWTLQGNTKDDREYYAKGDYFIYYDANCGGGSDTVQSARWMFDASHKPDVTLSQSLAKEGGLCSSSGLVNGPSSKLPSNAVWEMACSKNSGENEWTDVKLTIAPPTCICKLGYSGDNCEIGSAPRACDGKNVAGKQVGVSGICKYKGAFNGAWTLQGKTADGNEYYASTRTQTVYLYYDQDLGGDGAERTHAASWLIGTTKPSETASHDLAGDGTGSRDLHAHLANKELASNAEWQFQCDADGTMNDDPLTIAPPTCMCNLGYSGANCETGSAPRACDGEGAAGKKIVISGVCRRNAGLNGVWTQQGNTADGKAYYIDAKGGAYLYYDSNCGGNEKRFAPRWMFTRSRPSERASQDLAEDGSTCGLFGHESSTALASHAVWSMHCDDEGTYSDDQVTIAPSTCACKCGYTGDDCETKSDDDDSCGGDDGNSNYDDDDSYDDDDTTTQSTSTTTSVSSTTATTTSDTSTTTSSTVTTARSCNAGEYLDPNANTCQECPDGTYQPDTNGHVKTRCEKLRVKCSFNEFIVTNGTKYANIVCRTSEKCTEDEWESKSAVYGKDERECTPLTQCEAGQYISRSEGIRRDRECAECDATYYARSKGCTTTTSTKTQTTRTSTTSTVTTVTTITTSTVTTSTDTTTTTVTTSTVTTSTVPTPLTVNGVCDPKADQCDASKDLYCNEDSYTCKNTQALESAKTPPAEGGVGVVVAVAIGAVVLVLVIVLAVKKMSGNADGSGEPLPVAFVNPLYDDASCKPTVESNYFDVAPNTPAAPMEAAYMDVSPNTPATETAYMDLAPMEVGVNRGAVANSAYIAVNPDAGVDRGAVVNSAYNAMGPGGGGSGYMDVSPTVGSGFNSDESEEDV